MMSVDKFLGGKLLLKQEKQGLRATSDAVLCAAAVPIKKGESLLDVGAGNGVIGLCVSARTPCVITALEKQKKLIPLIQENARLNQTDMKALQTDILKADKIKGQLFHHVVSNPPFYDNTGKGRKNPQQKEAYQADFSLGKWLNFCLKHIRAKGTLTLIHRPECLDEILSVISKKLGKIEIIPIQSKENTPANRVIIRGKLGDKSPLKLLPPLIMHKENGDRTNVAEMILRQGKGI